MRNGRSIEESREAEIQELHDSVGRDEDVVWFDIAVDDAQLSYDQMLWMAPMKKAAYLPG